MNPKIKTLKSFLLFGVLSLVLFQIGCRHNHHASSSGQPIAVSDSNRSSLFDIRKQYASGSVVGEDYKYVLEVTALEDLGNVVIEERLPQEVRFLRSNPAAKIDNSTIFWAYPGMNKGETKTIDIYYTPEKDGEYRVCTIVSGDPRVCVPLIAGMPKLKLEKSGPATSNLGEEVSWLASITNNGTATARDVHLKDVLPEGLQAVSPTEYDLGDIAPGQTKQVKIVAKASRPGKYTNTAVATFKDSKLETQSSAPLSVIESKLEITKSGPSTAYVFSPAAYTITVRNVGMNAIENLKVTDWLPDFVNLVESGGGTTSKNQIEWSIDRLEPSQSKTYNVRFAANNPGETVNKAAAWNNSGLKEVSEVRTQWKAAPGIQISLSDNKDPIRVSESTTYMAKVLNQGDFEPVEASIRIVFTDELKPLSIRGGLEGSINGQEVIFPEVTIQPGKAIQAEIEVKGVKAGYGNAAMQVKADFLPKVLVSEQSTTVY